MNKGQLDAIRQRAEAATPGPWNYSYYWKARAEQAEKQLAEYHEELATWSCYWCSRYDPDNSCTQKYGKCLGVLPNTKLINERFFEVNKWKRKAEAFEWAIKHTMPQEYICAMCSNEKGCLSNARIGTCIVGEPGMDKFEFDVEKWSGEGNLT